jgi:Ca2+-binding RTX toxin-like protein
VTNIGAVTAGGHLNVSISGSAAANTLNFALVTLTVITIIDGAAGNDTITGSNAADVIRGGAGNDVLSGGAGNDTFVYATGFGTDVINGFDSNPTGGQDLLDLRALGVTAANFATTVTRVRSGADVRLTIGGNRITITNQTLANITITDFIVG